MSGAMINAGLGATALARPPAASPPPFGGADLVARATNPSTEKIDTGQLARWIADAARTSPDVASAAHGAIEAELGAGDASRFNADVANAIRADRQEPGGPTYSATGVALIPGVAGGRILRDNPILEIQWRSTVSPVTGKSGFSGPLRELLDAHGIKTRFAVNRKPANSTSSNAPAASTHNGNAARDAIAARLKGSGDYTRVGTEATENTKRKTSLGARHVDVVAAQAGKRPGMNKSIEIESKLGQASAGKDTRLQAAKDGERLLNNAKVRRIGTVLEGVGKVARPIGIAIDAVQVGSAYRADGNRVGDKTQRAVGSLAGGAAGAWGGAQVGVAIGAAGGPVGIVVGGVVGGVFGGIAGSGVGEKAVGWAKNWF